MKPEQVLELIGSAPKRYETVRAAMRYRGDGLVHKEVRGRIARTEAGRGAFRVSESEASRPPPGAGRPVRVALPGVVRGQVPRAPGDGGTGRRGRHLRRQRVVAERPAAARP